MPRPVKVTIHNDPKTFADVVNGKNKGVGGAIRKIVKATKKS